MESTNPITKTDVESAWPLWDVTIDWPRFKIKSTLRVRATDPESATGIACDIVHSDGPTYEAKEADSKQRKVKQHPMTQGERDERNIERQLAKSKRFQFARVLGQRPVTNKVKGATRYEPQLFEATFGPPEYRESKSGSILFWNFLRNDGQKGFSMFAEIPKGRTPKDVQVQIATRGNVITFINWTAIRLNTVENAIKPPAFLGSGLCVISQLN